MPSLKETLTTGTKVFLLSIPNGSTYTYCKARGGPGWAIGWIPKIGLDEERYRSPSATTEGTVHSEDGQFVDSRGVRHVPVMTKGHGLVEAVVG